MPYITESPFSSLVVGCTLDDDGTRDGVMYLDIDESARYIAEETGYDTRIITRGRTRFILCMIDPNEMASLGLACHWNRRVALVKRGMHPAAERFVLEHELKHLVDHEFCTKYKGPFAWFLREVRASTHALTDPAGFVVTLLHKSRSFYKILFTLCNLMHANPDVELAGKHVAAKRIDECLMRFLDRSIECHNRLTDTEE